MKTLAKKKPGKYLRFYERCMKDAMLPRNGLCGSFRKSKFFKLIDPEYGLGETYWGIEQDVHVDQYSLTWDDKWYAFSPLRQTIVLLMAAMNNEL